MSLKRFGFAVSVVLSLLLAGCGAVPKIEEVLPDKKVEYKKSRDVGEDLEVPPDLTSSTINDALTVPEMAAVDSATLSGQMEKERIRGQVTTTTSVLPDIGNVSVKRDGDQRWLQIQGTVEDVWFKTVAFWQENGILLVQQDPTTGIMVTDWLENRADIKSDIITDTVRKVFDGAYAAASRDQYRVRIEEGTTSGTLELFLTHRGMQEDVIQSQSGEVERTVWNPRATDHDLEAEMLRRLMNFMGIADQEARRGLARKSSDYKARSRLHKARDGVSLLVDESTSRAWRLVGVVLDRVGFAVEDRDRSRGLYFVRYYDPMKNTEEPGLLDKLAFWKDDENKNIDRENQYMVALKPVDSTTQIVVLNKDGVRENSDTAVRILTLLNEQIR